MDTSAKGCLLDTRLDILVGKSVYVLCILKVQIK